MKKIGVITFLAAFIVGQAAAVDISKVTYFPISYVGYHDVNATNLEVGLGRVAADGTLGGSETVSPVQTDNTSLAPNATLQINGTVSADTTLQITDTPVNIGAGQENTGAIRFAQNLRIGTAGELTNFNTPVATVQDLSLFGQAFPRCEATADSAGDNMHWVRLRLGAGDRCSWYLSCGAVAEDNQCTD